MKETIKIEENTNIPGFLIEKLKEQYNQEEVEKILKGYKEERKVTLRINTIKTNLDEIKEKLKEANIEYEEVKWSKEALIIKNVKEDKIRELEMYEKGEIYLQSLSSMLPPIILEPKPKENVLDMAAAPGGKTCQIAALTQNQSFITACEINKIRAERLKYNLGKQGVTNTFIMNQDARNLDDMFSFDKILLDAPCSGSGTISENDKNVKNAFTLKLIEKSTKTQLALLIKAIKLLKPGKEIIYSTCSILEEENEQILKKVLVRTKAKIVPINFEGIEDIPKLETKIQGTLLVCPSNLYEGFFVAKIKKG